MAQHKLKYKILSGNYAICRLAANAAVPEWTLAPGQLCSITRTTDELSIVCPQENIPADVKAATGWICLKLEGPFPFTQTGILTSFVEPLASHGIPIFVISSFETDYVLIMEEFSETASGILSNAGHQVSMER